MNGKWIMKRIVLSLFVLMSVLVLNFFLFRLGGADAVSTIVDPSFSQEAKANLRSLYGLDRPLFEQFIIYIKQMLSFSFGLSFLSRKPVWDEITSRLPVTLTLTVCSMVISAVLGTYLGIKAAQNRGKFVEKLVLRASAVTSSFPGFFVQLVLIMLFARYIKLFPLRGTLSVPPPVGTFNIFCDYVHHMALPVISISLMSFGGWALYVRNLMVRALSEDFTLMARARGLSEGAVLWHAFRTILPPIITIFLMSVPSLVSGAVITESVFSLNGLGTFLLEALSGNDYPSAGASFYLMALITVICNFAADITYGFVDPRVRIEGQM